MADDLRYPDFVAATASHGKPEQCCLHGTEVELPCILHENCMGTTSVCI